MNKTALVNQNNSPMAISPMELAQTFLSNGGDLVNLEKMMELQEQYDKKLAKKAYVIAMVKAQKEMPVVYEGRRNKQTNSQYSAYKDIIRDAKPIYTDAGLSVSFYEEDIEKENYIKLCADVYHADGHSQKFTISLPIDDKGAKGAAVKTRLHGVKSAISYGRGILLCNIFNIPTSADIDDDGNAAGVQYITEKQVSELTDMIITYVKNEEDFFKWLGVESVETIPANQYGKTLAALKGLKNDN